MTISRHDNEVASANLNNDAENATTPNLRRGQI